MPSVSRCHVQDRWLQSHALFSMRLRLVLDLRQQVRRAGPRLPFALQGAPRALPPLRLCRSLLSVVEFLWMRRHAVQHLLGHISCCAVPQALFDHAFRDCCRSTWSRCRRHCARPVPRALHPRHASSVRRPPSPAALTLQAHMSSPAALTLQAHMCFVVTFMATSATGPGPTASASSSCTRSRR